MNFLNNLNFKKKIFSIVAVPFLLIGFFTIVELNKDIKIYQTLSSAKDWIDLTVKISNFVHQTQKERGMTAGFLGSKGKKFSKELEKQREITDKKKQDLVNFIDSYDLTIFPKDFQNDIKDALTKIEKMDSVRNRVDNFTISTKEAISFYSSLNANLLKDIVLISKFTTNSDLKNDITAYSSFLLAKERAGIERAVGANTFARGSFAKGMKIKLIQLINEQKIYLTNFKTYSNKEVLSFYNNILKDDSVKLVQKMEQMLLNENFKIDSTKWFNIITKKINLLKKLDDFQSNMIRNKVDKILNSAMYSLIFFTLISLSLFVSMVIFIQKIISLLDYRMKILIDGLHYFVSYVAREKTHLKSIDLKGEDEFAKMAKLLNDEMGRVEKVIENDKKVVQEIDNVVKRVSTGYFDTYIKNKASTKEIERLKENINFMIHKTKEKFDILNKTLKHYSKKEFDYKLKDEEKSSLQGNFKEVIDFINIFATNMSEFLSIIANTSEKLNKSMHVLVHSSQKLNQFSNEHISEINQTKHLIENLRGITKNTLQNVNNINIISTELNENSKQGLEFVSVTEKNSKEIFEKIEAINDAIEIIDQIAFQTNILSLNAAVEAATAGEAGQGFAVVANEVRSLANKSSEAAKKIKMLVNEAEEKANDGKEIVMNLREGFDKLNQKINQTNKVIDTITNMNTEQNKEFNDIDNHISKLDNISKQEVKIASNIDSLIDEIDGLSNKLVSYM